LHLNRKKFQGAFTAHILSTDAIKHQSKANQRQLGSENRRTGLSQQSVNKTRSSENAVKSLSCH